jgi:hypothetical protein
MGVASPVYHTWFALDAALKSLTPTRPRSALQLILTTVWPEQRPDHVEHDLPPARGAPVERSTQSDESPPAGRFTAGVAARLLFIAK